MVAALRQSRVRRNLVTREAFGARQDGASQLLIPQDRTTKGVLMSNSDSVYAPRASQPDLAPDPEADAHVGTIEREGFVVLHEVLAPPEVAAMHAALAPYLQGKHMGRNDFEGFCSERVYALLAKDPALALLVEHPRLLAIVDRLLAPHYLLSAFLAINVHPGETAQGWHFDDGGCHVPLPRPMHGVSAIWALDDFTTENGATQVIPRSHLC